MRQLQRFFSSLIIIGTFLLMPLPVLAFDPFGGTNPNAPCNNSQAGQSSVCQTGQTDTNPAVHGLQIATTILALAAGMLAVVMIIIGGFQYVTSNGNTESVNNARKKIINSIIGLAIIALAWTIIRLVTDKVIQ